MLAGKQAFFESLCEQYYEKTLRYLYAALGNETAARDTAQEVFLVACQKVSLLRQHPNPGGFLFQTAKNLAHKAQREGFRRMMADVSLEDSETDYPDAQGGIIEHLDRQIDASSYVDDVLSQLPEDKRRLYEFYYLGRKTMSEIAADLGLQEAALRMRYVRLRKEIREIVSQVAEQNFEY